jgi:glycolate oxidase FAD binding subunit
VGYDVGRLLVGSLGTLGLITEVTLRVQPIPQRLDVPWCAPADLDQLEQLLGSLVRSSVVPAAVEVLSGADWQLDGDPLPEGRQFLLAVALEGLDCEVEWMTRQLRGEWDELGELPSGVLAGADAVTLLQRCAEFPGTGEAPLVLQASLAPSVTTRFVAAARALDPHCSILAHAGSGIVVVKLAEFPAKGLSKTLIGKLQPAAYACSGNVIILSNPSGAEMTRQSVWGGLVDAVGVMTDIKREFDPKNILNPDRFVYE